MNNFKNELYSLKKALTAHQKTQNLFKNYGIAVLCFLAYFTLVGILTVVFPELQLDAIKDTRLDAMIKENPLKFFILAVILAPLLEEGVYRTLIAPKPWEIAFFLACLTLLFAGRFFPEDVLWWLKCIISVLSLVIIYKLFRELLPVQLTQKVCNILTRFKIPIVIISSIIFGFAHVYNYVDSFIITLPLFIAIVPRIILGLLFAKVKIENNGLPWAMYLHAINNGVIFIIAYLNYSNQPL